MPMIFSTLCCLLILFCSFQACCHAVQITVGTCNLWNVMFNWETRIEHIADIIREYDVDFMAFQEVRLTTIEGSKTYSSQLDKFKIFLPEYKWSLTKSAGVVAKNTDAYMTEWSQEGLGVLSRKQIMSSSVVNLTKANSSDKNSRIALHVKVRVGPSTTDIADIIVVHFSYDRKLQCGNTIDILRIVKNFELQNVIILGDFNTYSDFESPVDLFTSKRRSVCLTSSDINSVRGRFKDAWLSSGRQASDGLSFSNMPSPGLQSRPDRILVSKNITVEQTTKTGNGTDFKKYYYKSVIISRTKSLLRTSFHALMGRSGYSCAQDCGPHGSCRCGMCVAGGNHQNCNIPDCFECTAFTFILFLTIFIPLVVCVLILFFTVLKVLIVSAKIKPQDVFEIFGYKCCLFNINLFSLSTMPRRYKTKMHIIFSFCRLPPMLILILTLALFSFLLLLFRWLFHDGIQLVYALLPEELFPSDHLIVVTKSKL